MILFVTQIRLGTECVALKTSFLQRVLASLLLFRNQCCAQKFLILASGRKNGDSLPDVFCLIVCTIHCTGAKRVRSL